MNWNGFRGKRSWPIEVLFRYILGDVGKPRQTSLRIGAPAEIRTALRLASDFDTIKNEKTGLTNSP
jgi:hypothetical protein